MDEAETTSQKNTKLVSDFKLLMDKLTMAKLLQDTKLKKLLNKELKNKKLELKKLHKELFMEGLLKL